MIRFSKLADYAVVILASLLEKEGELASASEISSVTKLPEPTVAKVLKLLSKANLVQSIRGAQGGYKMARSANDMHIADIVTAIDGPVALAACVEGSNDEPCSYAGGCPVKGRWDMVNVAVRGALEDITLADMIVPQSGCMKNNNFMEERA